MEISRWWWFHFLFATGGGGGFIFYLRLTAAETGHLQVVKVLLDANAEKDGEGREGRG